MHLAPKKDLIIFNDAGMINYYDISNEGILERIKTLPTKFDSTLLLIAAYMDLEILL